MSHSTFKSIMMKTYVTNKSNPWIKETSLSHVLQMNIEFWLIKMDTVRALCMKLAMVLGLKLFITTPWGIFKNYCCLGSNSEQLSQNYQSWDAGIIFEKLSRWF